LNTFLVSRPGALQASIRATLASFPQIIFTGSATGGLSALDKINEEKPALIVIDNNLTEDEVVSLLKVIKRAHPKLYCIVLVDTPTEMQRALSAGADGVLLRDSLSENLLSTLEEIGMPDPQANEEKD
jgi:DNA-binding NarL/FixJ family response regulator